MDFKDLKLIKSLILPLRVELGTEIASKSLPFKSSILNSIYFAHNIYFISKMIKY